MGSGENGNEHGGSIKDMFIAKGDMYFSLEYFRGRRRVHLYSVIYGNLGN